MGTNTKSNSSKPSTTLTIYQENNAFEITDSINEITLESRPFKLVFSLNNTAEVYLHASVDSSSYSKAINRKFIDLQCFYSYQTFAESPKNRDRNLFVVQNETRGFHGLYTSGHEEQFIRFDSINSIGKNKWYGVRSVNQIVFLDDKGEVGCNLLSNTIIYLVYSPGIEKFGKGLKLKFK